MVLDGRIVRVPRSASKSNELKGGVSLHQQHQLSPKVVRSPHITIWPGRNMWHVKDRNFRFYCAQLNRYKQELLLAEHRAQEEYKRKHQVNISADNKVLLVTIRKQACDEVELKYRLETSEDFVMSIPAEEWRITEPYTSDERERLRRVKRSVNTNNESF